MKKITIIGGGAWGSTIAQVLADNKKEILIYDINKEYINKINQHKHPCFDVLLSDKIKATDDLKKALDFSDFIFLSVPAQSMRNLFQKINQNLTLGKNFINLSKGIEFKSNKIISQIIQEEISANKIKNYAFLAGPSHAEEVVLRKITFLNAVSLNQKFALAISQMCSNETYLKVSTLSDVAGCEICSSVKNALAFISGILDNSRFLTNARSAFITFSLIEMKKILILFLNINSTETFLSLVGIGDLIVTVFNKNSRNYKAGKQIQMGESLEQIYNKTTQVIEGIYNLKVFYHLAVKNKVNLPIIESAYKAVFDKNASVNDILFNIFNKY
ncbi:NAD(P)H-dependent glycerol-3-phosphate dehydrogenase [Columbia Basin potato purple top phytoplasma]|uniref:Glycerol-3-phosphate dehydrogenase n=1 Tax=Columbia Basin potato purple top phytoplasma TaxID=307134 RepID=A0ABT5LA37_9MOLU|nr:NAD(P)H-dependent glycerol-3-phosphate dehydrogenase [Columbia Basin potato purple top phytoplasma]MDC9032106.1 NAD(P)H-dependent glycerol-3-phosphate dehydrogenase [Columbia Basin potato purple top phytoplasma]